MLTVITDKAIAVICTLITHQMDHIGIKEFKWDLCNKAFTLKGSFFIHKICILAYQRRNLNVTCVIGRVTEVKLVDIGLTENVELSKDISYMTYQCTARG